MTYEDMQLDVVVSNEHMLRKIAKIVSPRNLVNQVQDLETKVGRKGYGLDVAIAGLILQFFYDLTDREMEDRTRHDMAFRWFCGFGFTDKTPDHSFFCRVRKLLGPKRTGKIFEHINACALESGIMRQVFTFVDSSTIMAKETTWAERDKALKDGEDKLNNDNVKDYSADKDARFGCKGKKKFWYGYKRHNSVDMGSGLIKKVAVTPANVMDEHGFKHICPKGGMVIADKSYCLSPAQQKMRNNGCHSGAILKNNMKGKNKDKDKWLSSLRAPFEGVFSKQVKRARYRGIAKNQLQGFMEAIVFNVKRLIVINEPEFCVC